MSGPRLCYIFQLRGNSVALSPDEIQEVYEVAHSLRPAAESFARRYNLDPTSTEELLMEAADKVRVVKEKAAEERRPDKIDHLPAYLFTTYKHLLTSFARRTKKEESLSDAEFELPNRYDAAEEIEQTILVDEIARYMDAQSRFIFYHRLLGYSYKEIAELYSEEFGVSTQDNVLRSKYNKTINRLLTELTAGKSK